MPNDKILTIQEINKSIGTAKWKRFVDIKQYSGKVTHEQLQLAKAQAKVKFARWEAKEEAGYLGSIVGRSKTTVSTPRESAYIVRPEVRSTTDLFKGILSKAYTSAKDIVKKTPKPKGTISEGIELAKASIITVAEARELEQLQKTKPTEPDSSLIVGTPTQTQVDKYNAQVIKWTNWADKYNVRVKKYNIHSKKLQDFSLGMMVSRAEEKVKYEKREKIAEQLGEKMSFYKGKEAQLNVLELQKGGTRKFDATPLEFSTKPAGFEYNSKFGEIDFKSMEQLEYEKASEESKQAFFDYFLKGTPITAEEYLSTPYGEVMEKAKFTITGGDPVKIKGFESAETMTEIAGFVLADYGVSRITTKAVTKTISPMSKFVSIVDEPIGAKAFGVKTTGLETGKGTMKITGKKLLDLDFMTTTETRFFGTKADDFITKGAGYTQATTKITRSPTWFESKILRKKIITYPKVTYKQEMSILGKGTGEQTYSVGFKYSDDVLKGVGYSVEKPLLTTAQQQVRIGTYGGGGSYKQTSKTIDKILSVTTKADKLPILTKAGTRTVVTTPSKISYFTPQQPFMRDVIKISTPKVTPDILVIKTPKFATGIFKPTTFKVDPIITGATTKGFVSTGTTVTTTATTKGGYEAISKSVQSVLPKMSMKETEVSQRAFSKALQQITQKEATIGSIKGIATITTISAIPKYDVKPTAIVDTTSDTKQRFKQVPIFEQFKMTGVISEQPKAVVIPVSKQKQLYTPIVDFSSDIAVVQAQEELLVPITEQKTATAVESVSDFPPFIPPVVSPPPSAFILVPFTMGFGKGRKRRTPSRTKTKYKPSLTAIGLDIRATKQPKIITGFGIRPIISEPIKKKKKKKRTRKTTTKKVVKKKRTKKVKTWRDIL